jgi:hypothetical protein
MLTISARGVFRRGGQRHEDCGRFHHGASGFIGSAVVINLKKVLGIEIPAKPLVFADEVIK